MLPRAEGRSPPHARPGGALDGPHGQRVHLRRDGHHHGLSPAIEVVVTPATPGPLHVMKSAPPARRTTKTGITWNAGRIAVVQSRTFRVTVRPGAPGPVTAPAKVSSATFDPCTGNNASAAETRVVRRHL
ncbi:hypothetical protein [Streptomyces sp. NPDC048269]|uniref:hypothetical protein n=1 Tax=Streptomyces sp. NPDC048269 TaxID=3155753 RepID=UPI003426EDAA